MKVTYLAFLRYKKSNPSYSHSTRVVPGDHVELSDSLESFFMAEEVVQAPLAPKKPLKTNSRDSEAPSKISTTPTSPKEGYEDLVKGQIKDKGKKIPLTDERGNEIDDPFIFDPGEELREKVRQKVELQKSQKEETVEEPKKAKKAKKVSKLKGRKKCKVCGRFTPNCKCEG